MFPLIGVKRGCVVGLRTRQRKINSLDAEEEDRPPLKLRINLKSLNSTNNRERAVVQLGRLSFAKSIKQFITNLHLSITLREINGKLSVQRGKVVIPRVPEYISRGKV